MNALEEMCQPFESEKRAMEWLHALCSEYEWMSVDSEEVKSENTGELPVVNYKLNLQSKSGRKYRIVGQAMLTEHDITETQPILVFGSVAEPIETLEKVSWCQLCISPSGKGQNVPLADRLVSMVLGLHDDEKLSALIPLLEMFLLHEAEDHQWIQSYYSDGISLEQNDMELYDIIPLELRLLAHHFDCIQDEIQYVALSNEEKQEIFNEEMRLQCQKIREKKQDDA